MNLSNIGILGIHTGCVSVISKLHPTSTGPHCISLAELVKHVGLVFPEHPGRGDHPSGAAADHVTAGVSVSAARTIDPTGVISIDPPRVTSPATVAEELEHRSMRPMDDGGIQFKPELPQLTDAIITID